jgi:hypothetical protein
MRDLSGQLMGIRELHLDSLLFAQEISSQSIFTHCTPKGCTALCRFFPSQVRAFKGVNLRTLLFLSFTGTLGCRGKVETAVKGLVGRLCDGQAIDVKGLCHALNPAPAWSSSWPNTYMRFRGCTTCRLRKMAGRVPLVLGVKITFFTLDACVDFHESH